MLKQLPGFLRLSAVNWARVGLVLVAVLVLPAALRADTVSWAGIAPNWTVLSNPFSTTSVGGITVTGSMPSVGMIATHECFVPTFVTPCAALSFAQGDPLLFSNYTTGPMTFAFSSSLQAVSTQIQTNWYGAFSATITAYDSNGVNLGSVTIGGSSASTYDGTAPVLGIFVASGNISSVSITATSQYPNGPDAFYINQLNLTPVPEPGTLALLGTGVLVVGTLRRRQR